MHTRSMSAADDCLDIGACMDTCTEHIDEAPALALSREDNDSDSENAGRLVEYKHSGKTADANRGKRREFSVELRKSKRSDQFSQRRKIGAVTGDAGCEKASCMDLAVKPIDPIAVAYFAAFGNLISNGDFIQAKMSILTCRTALAKNCPPIKEFVASGILPVIVHVMRTYGDPEIQADIAWILTNVCSGERTEVTAVVNEGVVDDFVAMLSSQSEDVRDQCIWALANIAGESAEFRNVVLEAGAMEIFVRMISTHESLSVKRLLIWAIGNLCNYADPSPPMSKLLLVVPQLKIILDVCQDFEVRRDAYLALLYASKHYKDVACMFVHMGLVDSLFWGVCTETDEAVVRHSLYAIENVLSFQVHQQEHVAILGKFGIHVTPENDKSHLDVVCNLGVVPIIGRLMKTLKSSSIKCKMCQIVSEILAGTPDHRKLVFDSDILVTIMGTAARTENESFLIEVCHVISKALIAENTSHAEKISMMTPDVMCVILTVLGKKNCNIDAIDRMKLLCSLMIMFEIMSYERMPFLDMFNRFNGISAIEWHIMDHSMPPQIQEYADMIYTMFIKTDEVCCWE